MDRVTRHPRVFRSLTGYQRTPRFRGVTVRLGFRMRNGSGEITSVWNDPWVRQLPNIQVQSMIMQGLEDLKVSDLLWKPGRWNEEFIHQILSPIKAPIVCG